jgi:hypothetical protein
MNGWVRSAFHEGADLGVEFAAGAEGAGGGGLSMMPNQTSTRFSHDPEVGVTWTLIPSLAPSHSRISTRLWAT